jgi:DNA-binding NarL/FixJ family response regulator
MLPKSAKPRIVILKGDRLYGDLISRQIKELWKKAQVQVFQRGMDALDAIQGCMPDLFITGVYVEDMDGLEHLEPFAESALPILVVTSRKDARTLSLLRAVRYDGIFDALAEGMANLRIAVGEVMDRGLYVSPSMVPLLKMPKNITIDALTPKEQMVLSVIGDGSDDQRAGERLGLSPYTVNTHRKAIMGKLGLHHKGQVMFYALQHGYVRITTAGVYQPGFQRRLRIAAESRAGGKKECA